MDGIEFLLIIGLYTRCSMGTLLWLLSLIPMRTERAGASICLSKQVHLIQLLLVKIWTMMTMRLHQSKMSRLLMAVPLWPLDQKRKLEFTSFDLRGLMDTAS